MSTFTDALAAFIAAEREHAAGVRQWREWAVESYRQHPDHEDAERALAQAGDSLESEVRRMIREEVSAGVLARYEAKIPPPRYGMEGVEVD